MLCNFCKVSSCVLSHLGVAHDHVYRYEDMMDQKHQLHAELMASQASFRDATDQLDHSLKTADNLRDEVSDFHGFCNDRTIEFAGHEIS